MQNFFPELIRFNIPFIILIFLLAISVLPAVWLYRTTTPQSSSKVKFILGSLRASVLFLLLMLFFSPRLFIRNSETKKEEISVFIDNSASMQGSESDPDRWKQTLDTAKRLKTRLEDHASLHWYRFSSETDPVLTDTLSISNSGTNFSNLMNLIDRLNGGQIFIISDGNMTEGESPLSGNRKSSVKIHTIGIGGEDSGDDVLISDVIYKPVVYQDAEQEIEVIISNNNFSGQNLNLKFSSDGGLISSKTIRIDNPNTEQSVIFYYTPGKSGSQKFKLELDGFEGEKNSVNNHFVFIQDVLKSKLRIGIFAGTAGYESKFIRLLLGRQINMETYLFVEDIDGNYIQSPGYQMIDSLDVILFQDYPGRFTRPPSIEKLISTIRKNQPAFIVFVGENTNINSLDSFSDYLPFSSKPEHISSVAITISESSVNLSDPIVNVFPEPDKNSLFWNKIPPIPLSKYITGLKPKSKILIKGTGNQSGYKILATLDDPPVKSAVLNGSGFWKWHFLVQDREEIKDGYMNFLSHLIRWASNKKKVKPVNLEISGKEFYLGNKINIIGHLYNPEYRPITDGRLTLKIEWQKQDFTIETENDSSGNYLAHFIPPGEGRYAITGSGYLNGAELGTDKIEIEVIPFEKEYVKTGQNADFLRKLSKMGNGIYAPSEKIDSLLSIVETAPKVVKNDREIDLWYKPFVLFLIIGVIVLEWLLRKKFSLV
ncbi:MAG: hypothetical protein AB7T22_04870 [Calditrichaceae bacterium]